MAMGMTSTGGLKPVINVTPLIDVLLVLLIIFLMIQPQHKHGLATNQEDKIDCVNVVQNDFS